MKKKKVVPSELIPWYLNDTLDGGEHKAVEYWLETDPTSKDVASWWKHVYNAVRGQEPVQPSPTVWNSINYQINQWETRPHEYLDRVGWLVGSAISVLALILLWLVIRPGVIVEWSTIAQDHSIYRIYRSPVGRETYTFLYEVATSPGKSEYRFVDIRLLPGQKYIYRVDTLDNEGRIRSSRSVEGNASTIILGQFALVLSSLMVGVMSIMILREKPWGRLRPLLNALPG